MNNFERITKEVVEGKITLKQASEQIDTQVKTLRKSLQESMTEVQKEIESTTIELNDAVSKGDLSENAEYTNAVSALKQLRIQYANLNTRLEAMNIDLESVKYNPIDLVVTYTTVLLRDTTGRNFVFKVFPDNISDIENGILDAKSRIAKAIFLKEKGTTVTVEQYITGDAIQYKIIDMY